MDHKIDIITGKLDNFITNKIDNLIGNKIDNIIGNKTHKRGYRIICFRALWPIVVCVLIYMYVFGLITYRNFF